MSIPPDVFSPQPRPPEKSSNTCLILGLVFGGFGGFVLLCGGCCVGSVLVYFSEVERNAREDLADNKVLREEIGEIRTFELQRMASLEEMSVNEETFVIHVTGDKGSGTIYAVVPQAGNDFFVESATLILPDDREIELIEGMESPADSQPDPAPAPAEPAVPDPDQDQDFVAKVQAAIAANPVLVEKIGDIETFTYDIVASTDERGENTYVFHVRGSKGGGKLRAECQTVDPQTEKVDSAQLTLDTGEIVQLFPDKPLE